MQLFRKRRTLSIFLAMVLAVTMVLAEALTSEAYAADPVAALGVTQSGTVGKNASTFYQFTVPAGGVVKIGGTVEYADSYSTSMSLKVSVFQQDGSRVGQSTYYLPQTGRKYLDDTYYLTKGTYTIALESKYQAVKYSFTLNYENAQGAFSEVQGGSNNSFDSASALSMNKTYRVLFARNDVKSFYRFQLSRSQNIRLVLNTLKSEGFWDVRLYDSNRVQVQDWSWFGWTKPFYKVTDVLPKGTYYLEVASGNKGGIYSVQIADPIPLSQTAIKLSATSYTYSGRENRPGVTVSYGGSTVPSWNKYDVTYSANVNAGIGKVLVRGKGEYSGTVTKTFKIKPTAPQIKSVKRLKKGFKISWAKKKKAEATGYQVQYSTKKSMKGAKTKTVRASSKTIKGLKSKKTYYVRIRAYKQVGKQKVYSSWTSKKKVRTK